jgi:hypothetical protein
MRTNLYSALLVVAFAASGCKDSKQTHANASAQNLRADLGRAREAAQRTVDGYVPKVRELVGPITAPLTGNDPPAIRSTLVGFTTPGGPMTLYPTSFVAVTGRDGIAIARDIANESEDRMKGMDLKALFSCVRQATEGIEGMCVGEIPPVGNLPSRVMLVAAAPIKNAANEVIGTISAGLTYGAVARMIDSAVRGHVGDAVFWTGLRYHGRVLPSGTDQDVPRRWLVPASLIREIPAAQAQRIESAGGEHFFPFIQDNRGWAGVIAALPMIPETQVVLFRSEASQR